MKQSEQWAVWPRMLVGDVAIDLLDRKLALTVMHDCLTEGISLAVISANLNHIHEFARSESSNAKPLDFNSGQPAYHGMRSITLLDGVPLVRRAKVLTGRKWPKLSGSDLILDVLSLAGELNASVGFLGGQPEMHRDLRRVISKRFPAVRVSGSWGPTALELADQAASELVAAEIRATNTDILVVCLSKPRQEHWIARFGPSTGAGVVLAFGAAADFLAGHARRAPNFVAEAGLEWAWRLVLEPRRLWRRYVIEGPPSLWKLISEAKIAYPMAGTIRSTSASIRAFADSTKGHAEIVVIIVTYNSERYISKLLSSIRHSTPARAIGVIVVDNNSTDRTVEAVSREPGVLLIRNRRNLGYAGGINVGLSKIGSCQKVIFLNPDLTLQPDTIARMVSASEDKPVGAVVPLNLDRDGAIYPSLRREPSVMRAVGDALFGSIFRRMPPFLSEIDLRPESYETSHNVDWATGSALLVNFAVVQDVGPWPENYFMYSEETEYMRRIRQSGWVVKFVPSAVVQHWIGGSGTSSDLTCLRIVNRIRYVERHHGRIYSGLYRAVVLVGQVCRAYDRSNRRALAYIINRKRWKELPRAV